VTINRLKTKYIGLLIVSFTIATLYYFINPSTSLFPKCPFYVTTGLYCPGCGSQRALHDFLHLNFKGVIGHNILFVVGIVIALYQATLSLENFLFKKNRTNLLYHKATPIVLLVFVLLFWILRNIPLYPFNLLAPD